MKTTAEHSLVVARIAFTPSTLIRDNMRRVGLSALILLLSALHLPVFVASALAVSPTADKNGGSQQWSLRVDKIDTGGASLDPSFESALHKNLLRELAKTRRFKQVLLSGNRNANDVPDLLILKTRVQEHAPRSGARWAGLEDEGLLGDVAGLLLRVSGWTTASGATRLNAHIQLYTREGRLVLDNVVEGDVGFTSNNSRATHNLARNVADALKRSPLPGPAMIASQQQIASIPKY
jgi:hypothetical protein